MVINVNTTSISFYPFIDFTGIASCVIEVWHKPTKVKVSETKNVLKLYSKVTIDLPDMTTIDTEADDLDTVLIRVYNGTSLIWEYLATWSDGVTNINQPQKEWETTNPSQPNWARV